MDGKRDEQIFENHASGMPCIPINQSHTAPMPFPRVVTLFRLLSHCLTGVSKLQGTGNYN